MNTPLASDQIILKFVNLIHLSLNLGPEPVRLRHTLLKSLELYKGYSLNIFENAYFPKMEDFKLYLRSAKPRNSESGSLSRSDYKPNYVFFYDQLSQFKSLKKF